MSSCQLLESDLYAGITAEQIESIRAKAPAGEDPISSAIVNSCAVVDSYCTGRTVPARMLTKLALDLCVFDLVKILGKSTQDQKSSFDNAYKMLEQIQGGKFGFANSSSDGSTPQLAWGSKGKIL